MPKKKKKKAKGKKVAGKGSTKHAGDAVDDVTNNEQKQGTLDSQMQRLQIAGGKPGDEDEEAMLMLEEAIQLAAAEKKEIEKKEKENCTHGFNPTSRSQEHFCKDFMQTVMNEYYAAVHRGDLDALLGWFRKAFDAATEKHISWMGNNSNIILLNSCFLAEGTKYILDGNYDDIRIHANVVKYLESLFIYRQKQSRISAKAVLDPAKMVELGVADEHTLVQFYRKQIPCSCLDEKYNEVKSVTKMGMCCNEACPLPDQRAVRSKMVCCARCRMVNYCSRECQVAAWPEHKEYCGSWKNKML